MPVKSPIAWPNGKAYMFQGADYVRYDFRTGALDQAARSIAQTNWPGLRGVAPDAAVHFGFGKVYFFYGDEYVRFDIGLNTVEPEYLPPNPPTKIAGNWAGLPNDWATTKIDVAVNWGNGKVYFFRGSEYLRYDITLDRSDPDYPKSIAGNWNGLWDADLDGVLYQGGKKAYFFKGNDYRRYDLDSDGIGAGNGPANDCHNQGRALDFSAIEGTLEGVPFVRQVKRDWGDKVVLPGISLRLDPVTDPLADSLFRTVYRFGTFEGESNGIGAANKWPPKNVEDGKRFVIHPDYVDGPGENLRVPHQNHIHMQIGDT
jgi:Hemopexin